jgi:hypothetical protein
MQRKIKKKLINSDIEVSDATLIRAFIEFQSYNSVFSFGRLNVYLICFKTFICQLVDVSAFLKCYSLQSNETASTIIIFYSLLLHVFREAISRYTIP